MKLKRKAGSKLTSSKTQAATDAPVADAQTPTPAAPPEPKAATPAEEQQEAAPVAEAAAETPIATKPVDAPASPKPVVPEGEQGAVPPALKFDDVPAQEPVVTDVPQPEPPTSVQQSEPAEKPEDMTLSDGRTRGVAEDFKAQQALGSLIVDQQNNLSQESPVLASSQKTVEVPEPFLSSDRMTTDTVIDKEAIKPAPLGFTPPDEEALPAQVGAAAVAESATKFKDPFADEAEKPPIPPEPEYGEDTQTVEAVTGKTEESAPFIPPMVEDGPTEAASNFTQEVAAQETAEKSEPFVPPMVEDAAPSAFTVETQEQTHDAPAPFVPPMTDAAAPTEPQGFVPPTDTPAPSTAETVKAEKDDVQALGDEPEPFVPPQKQEISSSGDSGVLPWMEGSGNNEATENDGWEIDGVTDQQNPVAQDVYNDITGVSDAEGKPEDKAKDTLPPWAGGSKDDAPPILPGQDESNTDPEIVKGDFLDVRKIVLMGGAVALLMGAYLIFVANQEKTTEFLARWTGTLDEVSQEVVTQEQAEVAEVEIGAPIDMPKEPPFELATPEVAVMNDDVMVEPEPELLEPPLIEEEQAAAITEPTDPQNGSLFDSIQSKFAEARAKKEQERMGQTPTQQNSSETPTENRLFEGEELQRQLEQELAAYRQTLAAPSRSAVKPKPQEFFDQTRQPSVAPAPTLAPTRAARVPQPQQEVAAQQNVIPNPQNLPIVGEPKTQQKSGVRTLEEFDVAMFEPKHERVRIPKGVSPSLRARTFPEMELLSLVPGRGIIAAVEGREGILLVGEVIQGWELLAVYEEYAEFQNAGRRYTLALQ